jgi:hypothetical protein
MPPPLRLPNASEQQVLQHLVVRPITQAERPRWNAELCAHHYLHNATLVGEHLCYVAESQGRRLALPGWSAAARRRRDAWIGWSEAQRAARRPSLANNARFCIPADRHQLPNLASRALALCTARVSADWQERWGHPIVAVESFVDGQRLRGTAYKATGWQRLDATRGFGRVAGDSYLLHDQPKQLWVRVLDPDGFQVLSAPHLPPKLAPFERQPPPPRPRCRVPAGRLVSLVDKLPGDLPDPCHPKGRWHPWRAILGIVVLAKLCGVPMGQRQIAEFARRLSKPQRRGLGCRRSDAAHTDPKGYAVPAESTFQRALAALDSDRLEPLLIQWQHQQLGPQQDDLIAIDDKHLRRSGGRTCPGPGTGLHMP